MGVQKLYRKLCIGME
jgi:hypothetical protein